MGSNPAGGMDASLLYVFRVVTLRSARRADHSSGGALQSMVFPAECDVEDAMMRMPWATRGCYAKEEKKKGLRAYF